MLIILVIFLVIVSVLIVITKRNREAFYLTGMCLSLAVMLTGILIYIAKKGGISRDLNQFFFLTLEIKTKIQYLLILLDQLGYIVAIGRYLFPLFLVLLALNYSMVPFVRKNHKKIKWTFLFPIGTLTIYYPKIFRTLTLGNNELQSFIVQLTNVWIVIYVLAAATLLIYEAYSINMKFFRRQFMLINTFILSLSVLYLLYFMQDPAQVYQFYRDNYIWKQGIYYMNATLSIPAYIAIMMINLICAVVGITSFFKYAQASFETNREEIIKQRKFNVISNGASVFVHSIKNQLLANRVIYKRVGLLYQEENPDLDRLKEYTESLSANNEMMLSRLDELYKSVKSNAVHLIPLSLEELVERALELFSKKYPENTPIVNIENGTTILADENHLCEAVYNLLTNAQEAVNDAGRDSEGRVFLNCYNIRLYTVIEVVDNGIGMNKNTLKKIFDPFYSSKNSNYNWGMGLHYVREIVKEHFGSLRYESKVGEGSHFYILLPKFKV
ncbi:MAG: ATP-binding protein [Mobilitalea sp.]